MKRPLIGLGVLFALAAAAQFFWSRSQRAEWEERLAALRARGEIVDFADLEPPPIPHERNAAPILLRAEQLGDWFEPWMEFDVPRAQWSDEMWSRVRAFLDERAEYGRLLEQAAAMPDCRFDQDYSIPSQMRIPFIPILFRAREFLEHRAILEARDGDSVRAARSLLLFLDTSDRSARHTLISHLIQLTSHEHVARTLLEIAALPVFRAREVRAMLDPRFARCEELEAMDEVLRAERAFAIDSIRRLAEGGDLSGLVGGERDLVDRATGPFAEPLVYRGGVLYLNAMEATFVILDLPFSQAAEEARAIVDQFSHDRVARMLTPLIPKCVLVRANHAAWMRLARLGLAVLEHREETGAWPGGLDALAPKFPNGIPTDPFTGDAFLYRRGEAGARLEAAVPVRPGREDQREEDEIVWRFRQED